MTANEIREKSKPELEKELTDLKAEYFKLRFQHATNQLENPMKIKQVRRLIARIRTIMREMEIKEAKG